MWGQGRKKGLSVNYCTLKNIRTWNHLVQPGPGFSKSILQVTDLCSDGKAMFTWINIKHSTSPANYVSSIQPFIRWLFINYRHSEPFVSHIYIDGKSPLVWCLAVWIIFPRGGRCATSTASTSGTWLAILRVPQAMPAMVSLRDLAGSSWGYNGHIRQPRQT